MRRKVVETLPSGDVRGLRVRYGGRNGREDVGSVFNIEAEVGVVLRVCADANSRRKARKLLEVLKRVQPEGVGRVRANPVRPSVLLSGQFFVVAQYTTIAAPVQLRMQPSLEPPRPPTKVPW